MSHLQSRLLTSFINSFCTLVVTLHYNLVWQSLYNCHVCCAVSRRTPLIYQLLRMVLSNTSFYSFFSGPFKIPPNNFQTSVALHFLSYKKQHTVEDLTPCRVSLIHICTYRNVMSCLSIASLTTIAGKLKVTFFTNFFISHGKFSGISLALLNTILTDHDSGLCRADNTKPNCLHPS